MSIKAISVSKVYSGSVNKRYKIDAVKNVSIDINEGSFIFISGPTGSGKTTLLSLLAGIMYPTHGEIVYGNIHVSTSKDNTISKFREEFIGYAPQNTLLIKELTVLENVLSPNSFYKRSIKELKSSAHHLLEKLKLINKKNCKPGELSGGEIKKVMIIRALVKKPLFIFADEPCSELDNESTDDIISLLYEQNRRGSAVIIASHNSMVLKENADFYTMEKGKITEYKKGGI